MAVQQDAVQPVPQLLFAVSLEIGKSLLGANERFLHQVRRPELARSSSFSSRCATNNK